MAHLGVIDRSPPGWSLVPATRAGSIFEGLTMEHLHRRRGIRAAAATLLAVVALGATAPPPAGAETSSTLRYSTDGGATWSPSAVAAPGQRVLVRAWFDNDGDAAEADATLRSEVPAPFERVAGTTKVCLAAGTTDPSTPDEVDRRCADADETAAWTGTDLAISPSAGHFGAGAGDAVGPLAPGRARYLNLHQCSTTHALPTQIATDDTLLTVARPVAGTRTANVADTAPVCSNPLTNTLVRSELSGVQAFDLLGNRSLTLHQCRWVSAAGRGRTSWLGTMNDAQWNTGSGIDSTPDTALSCPTPTDPTWTFDPLRSAFQDFDVLDNRYLHLFRCKFTGISTLPTVNVTLGTVADQHWTSATRASDDPTRPELVRTDAGPTFRGCATVEGMVPYTTGSYSHSMLDLLDTQRGRGYVEYELEAPEAPAAELCADGVPDVEEVDHGSELTSDPSGTKAALGDLAIDWSTLDDPCGTSGIALADPVVGGLLGLAALGLAVRQRRATSRNSSLSTVGRRRA
jgi:hypothetical protein